MNRKIKVFLIYAYSFIFLYMFNSLVTWLFVRFKLSPLIGTFLEALIMIVGLFFSFRYLIRKYYLVDDDKLVTKAWLFHFIPFIVSSFLLFFLIFSFIKIPSFAIFVYLNLDILLLFFTYKFAVEKFIEERNG
jgi:divalent metal cation (Fe/Co/Zn/Cd) transporter